MTRLRRLANSVGPLSEVLVDKLRRRGTANLSVAANEPMDDGAEQLDLPLADEEGDAIAADAGDETPAILRPDHIAAAVLLGRGFEQRRELLARLQDRGIVAAVEVPQPEFVDPIKRLLLRVVLGPDTPILEGSELDSHGDSLAPSGTVAVFVAKDDGRSKGTTPGNARFATATQRRCAILGIANDPDRLLPPGLLRLAEQRIVVPPLDGGAVAAVIEAITGRHPGPVCDDIARRVTLEALNVAVRADLGAQLCLARLRRIVDDNASSARPTPTLSELHGLGAARDWGLSLVKDLRDYVAGRIPWGAVDRGCLLTGVPGTGKTTFARALASEADVHFISTSYSQWQAYKEGHLGTVTQAIRNAFAEARQHPPTILFIDEIDTLPARGRGKWNDDWWVSITNTLLEQLDGFERREGVIVIAACNDASRLDPALVRAGRLDRHIEIPLPDFPGLIGIFRTHLGEDLAGVDLRAAALAARGATGADVERVVREARRKARIVNRSLTVDDLVETVRGGRPEWSAEVRRRIAYHEAGHAIAVRALGIAAPIALSIGGSGGMAESELDNIARQPLTRSYLEQSLIFLLAGRASEELAFGEATAGAGGGEESDLGRATDIAIRIETSSGLGALGLVCIAEPPDKRDLLRFHDLRIAVGRTMDRAHAAARDLLARNRRALDALAEALFKAGYLDRAEIAAVLKQTPVCPEVSPASQASALRTPSAVGQGSQHAPANEQSPIDSGETPIDRSSAPSSKGMK